MKGDEWIESAVTDASLVAELLLRLKEPESRSSSSPPPMRWGKRKPRSKDGEETAAEAEKKIDVDPMRRSPKTPLSWSGGGGSDGCEESSSVRWDPMLSAAVRSKDSGISETTNASNKTSRRKKTFAKLKEEEVFLLEQRSYLKRELETLHVTLNEQRSLNLKLKRIKTDSGAKSSTTSNGSVAQNSTTSPCFIEASTMENSPTCAPKQISQNDHVTPELCPADKNTRGEEHAVFLLPDLNMMPDKDCDPSDQLMLRSCP